MAETRRVNDVALQTKHGDGKMHLRRGSALLLTFALSVPVMTLTSTPTMAAASDCPAGPNNTCYWSDPDLRGYFEGHTTVRNVCINLNSMTARSAWNRSKYRLTVYEHASCTGRYQSTASGGKINRETWRIGAFKLT
ncbi:hypothetical protein DI272_22990 [Streptomyces sp. Act143]|uniref:peptidase inhibitor family I36 protein n=1 Tax=Streptomyces sp. Act143 TaxID=2200760 RepID=UPI000D680873|nr:hypothetical protein DI272_22990 [Streptomyces sp. Act143]